MADANKITAFQKQKIDIKPLETTSAEDTLNEINRGFAEKKAISAAKKINLPYIDILNVSINTNLTSKINVSEIKKALVLPFFQVGKKLKVASSQNQTRIY